MLHIIAVIFVVWGIVFFFLRSSNQMPSNWEELRAELLYQWSGCTGLAEDIVAGHNNKVELYDQTGRVAILTGGNRGIGLRILEKLLKCNITVILAVRDPVGSQKVIEEFLTKNDIKNGKIFYEKCDVGNMSSVRNFAAAVQVKHKKIDLLINNAGVMCVPYKLTEDGFESQMAINYIGHFLLSHLLLPQLKAAGTDERRSRIVNVSSCVHSNAEIDYNNFHGKSLYYPPISYSNSKQAQIFFTMYLNYLCREENINVQVNAVHPGIVNTELFQNSYTSYVPFLQKFFFKTAEQGSRTVVYAAISKNIEGLGGTYLSNCRVPKIFNFTRSMAECEKCFNFTCEMLKIKEFMGNK